MHQDYKDYYNEFGEKYFKKRLMQDGMYFNEKIEIPAVLKLLEKYEHKRNLRMLDIGCAFGFYSRHFSLKGVQVTAVDISDKMISLAKEFCKDCIDVDFILGDFSDLDFNSTKYDIVLGNFMLGYFNNLNDLFSKVKAVTTPNSTILFSMLHPIVQSKIERTENGYLLENYFDTGLFESDFLDEKKPIRLNRSSLQDIFQSCKSNKLYIDFVIEPKPIPAVSDAEKKQYDFFSKCPSLMIFSIKHLS